MFSIVLHLNLLTIQVQQQTSTFSSQYTTKVTQFEDPITSESVYIQARIPSSNFQLNTYWVTYNSNGVKNTQRMCPAVASTTSVQLSNNFLFIKTSQGFPGVYACKYDSTKDSTALSFNTQTLFNVGNDQIFDAFFISSTKLGLLKSDKTANTAKLYFYMVTENALILDSTNSLSQYTIPAHVGGYDNQFKGNPHFVYDSATGKLWIPNIGSVQKNWIQNNSGDLVQLVNAFVTTYYLKGQNFVIVRNNYPSNIIYTVTNTGVTNLQLINDQAGVSTRQRFFSDNVWNFLRATNKKIYWMFLTDSLVFSRCTVVSLKDGSVHDVAWIDSSKNKAAVFYTNGNMQIVKRQANGSPVEVFKKSVSSSLATGSFSGMKNYLVKFKCPDCTPVPGISQLYCFTQTSNCVLLNKAPKTCT